MLTGCDPQTTVQNCSFSGEVFVCSLHCTLLAFQHKMCSTDKRWGYNVQEQCLK